MRLIDADDEALRCELFTYRRYTGIDELPYEDATKALDNAPTVEERPTAEWIWVVGEAYKCSACGNMNYIMGGKWNYCSNCGAKMEESEKEK